MTTTFAILPVKRFDRAKQRLDPTLEPAQRQALAEAMVGDVLNALGRLSAIAGTIVVSGEPLALELAERAGAEMVRDDAEQGQSAAALLGIERALARGAERVVLVPGDCPALDPAELEAILDAPLPAPSVTVIPDRHRTGTNGLLLCPPTVIEPSFGPGSCARHRARGEQAGAMVRVEPVASLGLDVDTGGDLQALREALAARAGGAPRTRAALETVVSGSR